ncbi:PDZ domain-containing protein [Tepidibacillus fermentans]|uniref:PDZ domain-containing protein n=1 Tax=Tepidibacillus fermentans TaxID=1281767 RepID=A0A4R3KJ39_9BACI|nr:PDZ domain-containing protein [Tepidibacillus fermentans]TCS83275.1 PDZ domain-containing protein [Tepidibacillus fermentans]
MPILQELFMQIGTLFLQPLFYIGILLLVLQYRRQIQLERKLFSARIHSLSQEVILSLAYGFLGGVIASAFMVGLGVVFQPNGMWLLWLITGILTLFHIRFLCLSYSTGILGLLVSMIQLFPSPNSSFLQPIWIELKSIHVPSLIAIVAILHLVEGILIRLQAGKQATPLFVETKRGKLIGGYSIQSFWLAPLFLLVATGDVTMNSVQIGSWWPIFGAATTFSLFPVPVLIGYSELTTVYSPYKKSKISANYLIIYSTLLLVMAFLAERWAPFQFIASIFAGLAHEGIHLWGKRKERALPPLYVHPTDGLKILAVIPNSPADRMGVKAGEVIKKVNGMQVTTRTELYDALQLQPAFTKLEVINEAGHVKLVQHSLYAGDHHQLGILLAPDDKAPYYIEVKDTNLLQLLKQKVTKVSRSA